MSELKELSAQDLLVAARVSDHVKRAVPAAVWAEIHRRLERLEKCEAALRRISTEHINYGDPIVGNGTYSIGVVDGHRCAAKVALAALESDTNVQRGNENKTLEVV